MENNLKELKRLGWFDLTLPEYVADAEKALKECLGSKKPNIDTTSFAKTHPLLTHFEEAGLDKYGRFSLDFRVFSDDPEGLSEGDISSLLKRINESFRLRGDKLFDEVKDEVNTEAFGYSVVIDGINYPVYTVKDEKNYNWSMGINAVVKMLDSLLEQKNDKTRLYFSWGGDNAINFFLLTEPLYSYIFANGIDGGFGKITKAC